MRTFNINGTLVSAYSLQEALGMVKTPLMAKA